MTAAHLAVAIPAIAVIPAVALFGGARQVAAPEPVVALTNTTMLDGTGSPSRPRTTVLIRGRRIEAVFATGSRALPSRARIIDLTGRYVMPGLIDAHVHLGTQQRPAGVEEMILRSVFLDGVTTVRDMGGSLRIVRPLAIRSSRDTALSPRIYYSAILAGPGRWFTGPFGANASDGMPIGESPAVRLVTDRSNVAAVIRDAKNAGVTGIKIYNGVSRAMVRRLVAEAHHQGLRAWSHLFVEPAIPSDIVAAGIEVVSHGDQFRGELAVPLPLDLADSARRQLRQAEYARMSPGDPRLERLLRRMRAAGTMLDPTLFIMLPRAASGASSRASVDRLFAAFHFNVAMTKRAASIGIPIVAGTDAIGGSTANLHTELRLLVDSAGLTALQALRAAGLNAARAIGIQDSLGSIAAGKLADLIVLRADPSIDIRNTRTVIMVIKGGVITVGPTTRP